VANKTQIKNSIIKNRGRSEGQVIENKLAALSKIAIIYSI
jgi:hypothetical protein